MCLQAGWVGSQIVDPLARNVYRTALRAVASRTQGPVELATSEAHVLSVGYDMCNLLLARLAPDTHPLSKQLQFART